MWDVDVALAVGQAALVIALSVLGAHIAANKLWHRATAVLLGIIALGLIALQAYRNQVLQSATLKAQREHQAAQSTLQADITELKKQVKGLAKVEVAVRPARVPAPASTTQPSAEVRSRQAESKRESSQVRPPTEPVPVAHTRYSVQPTAGTTVLPHAVQVILSTDLPVESPEFTIYCFGEIYDARIFIAGIPTILDLKMALSVDRTKLTFSFSSPSFSPDSPVIVTLLSKSPLKVLNAYRHPKNIAESAEIIREHLENSRKTTSDPSAIAPK